MVKVINTLIEKKENCGHNVLVECAKALNVTLPVFSKQVKTADLYLLNVRFKKTFDDIYSLAIQYRESQDLTADRLDREHFIKEIKSNSEIITKHSREFDKKYRETATLENESEITANALKGMVSYLNKINNSSIEIDLTNIRYTSSEKIEVENLEDLIKKRKKSKSLSQKVETRNTQITNPYLEKQTSSQTIESSIKRDIEDSKEESKSPQKIKISKKKPKEVEVSKQKISSKEITINDNKNSNISKINQIKNDKKKITPKKKAVKKELKKVQTPKEKMTTSAKNKLEVTGIIGEKENLQNTSLSKDKKKNNNSFMQQRYELYTENCSKNGVEPVPIKISILIFILNVKNLIQI